MKVWTKVSQPFRIGGYVRQPISAEIEPAAGPFEIGKGYQAVYIVSPSGKIFVVEVYTGGIVGNSLEAVRKDVESAEQDVLWAQLVQESNIARTTQEVSPEEFWQLLRAS